MPYQISTLDNGVTVITDSMPDVRSVTVGLWFNVGARDERKDQAGLTHFMEHMMFKGTPTKTAVEISAIFDGLGAELNAFTSKEYTCYYTRLVDEKLPQAFPVLAEMVCDSTFTDDTIEPEREVVIEEIARSEDTPDDHVFDLFMDAVLPTHPLGRPVLGTRELVGSYRQPNCREFHDTHYHSGNLVVAAAGHVDHEAVVALAERYLGHMRTGERTVRDDAPESNRTFFTAQQKETEQAHLVYGMPWMDAADDDRYAGALLSSILGGSMSSRLFQEVREKNGLAYAVFSHAALYRDLGQFCIYCGTRPDNLSRVVEIIRQQLALIAQTAPTTDEIERQRESICGQLLLGLESTSGRMIRMGRALTMGLELHTPDELVERYRTVSADDLLRVASTYLAVEPTFAVVSPFAAEKAQELVSEQ